jgi:hypothetical protein
VHRVRGESAWLHDRDVGRCIAELGASCAAFESARALRALALTRLNAASLRGWSGDLESGLELVARSREDATRLGATFLLRYGAVVEAFLLAYGGDERADEAMRRALEGVGGSPRLSFLCRFALGWRALGRGDLDTADAEARAASAIAAGDHLAPAGVALAARVACRKGRGDDAIALASDAAAREASCRDLELLYGVGAFALAEAHAERGAIDRARVALAPAVEQLSKIASTLSVEARDAFWSRTLANAEIRRLGAELGVIAVKP